MPPYRSTPLPVPQRPRAARLGAAGLGLVALLAAASARGQASNASTNGFQDIQVDLSGQIFSSVLPFDVPFLIHGEVPVATTRVGVQFIGSKRPFRVCDPSVRRFQRQVAGSPSAPCPIPDKLVCYAETKGGGEQAFDCAWEPQRTGPITWVQQLPVAAGALTTTFRMAMPPLEASRFYAFKFVLQRKLTDDELAQVEAQVKQAADATLANNTGNTATEADNEAVRTALIQSLQQIAGSDVRVDSSRPLLDSAVPYSSLSETDRLTFSQRIGGVVRAQRDKENQLRLRSGKQMRLEPKLQAIAASGALDKLVARLRQRAASGEPGSAIAGDFVQRNEGALQMADLSQGEVAQHATGEPRSGNAATVDLGAARQPGEATPYVEGYTDTAQRLAGLQDWLDGQIKELDAGAGSELTSAEVGELKSVLDATVAARDLSEQLTEHARSVTQSLDARKAALDALAAAASAKAAEADLLLPASSLGDFKTQQSYYIAADFGMAYGPDLERAVPYFGTNIYFRPVNKDAPLSFRSSFGRRFAVTIGLTVKSIADSSPQTRSDLFDANSLLVGAGYRVTDSARIGAGVLVFNERNPNPLLGSQNVTYSPYISVSFDWDILSFFRGFGAIYGQP